MGRTACTEPQCLYKGVLYLTYLTSCTNTAYVTVWFQLHLTEGRHLKVTHQFATHSHCIVGTTPNFVKICFVVSELKYVNKEPRRIHLYSFREICVKKAGP